MPLIGKTFMTYVCIVISISLENIYHDEYQNDEMDIHVNDHDDNQKHLKTIQKI